MNRGRGRRAISAAWLALPALLCAQPAQVTRATLDNGMRVVIVRDTLAPVVTTMMNYLAGSDETPPHLPGLAHAQEHMMFRGSPGLSAGQLANISAAMGGEFDADTQQNVTQYIFTVPSADLDVALRIEAIRMRGVTDSEALWRQERGAIDQEVARDLSNPEFVFYTKLLEIMFRGTPYENSGLGTTPTFAKTTSAELKRFHQDWYAPNNAILIVCGDVDPQRALGEIKALFGGIPSRPLPPRPKFQFQPVKPQTINLSTDLPYGLAVIAFRLPGYDSPDYAAAKVLSDVLSSPRNALYELVVQGRALAATFELNGLPKASVAFAAAGFPAGQAGTTLVDDLRKVLAGEVAKGASAELVEAAKKHEIADAEFRKNSISGLAAAWSKAVAVEGRQSPEEDVRAIARVTVADVNRVARQYLDLSRSVTAILTPQPSAKPVSSQRFGKESFTPKEVKPVKLPAWAEQALAKLTVPRSTVHPEVTTLGNGLRLIVQRESISNTVSVYGNIKHNADLETPPGKEGVSDVLSALFPFGTKTLDRVAFQRALDDIGAEESAGTSFELKVLPEEFERGIELLADNELNPALPQTAFNTVRKQVAEETAGELKSPDYLADRALDKALFPKNDPTLRQPTPASVAALTLADVEQYYRIVFRPDLTTIVIIGNIAPERARAAAIKYFGAWKAAGPKPETDLPPVPPNPPSSVLVPDPSRVQDSVKLAETLGLTRFDPDYYPLALGNRILGSGFYASRLYRELREVTGLVYFVSSSLVAGRTRAAYSVEYGCLPQNVGRTRAIVEAEVRSMQARPVSAGELHRAKALALREIPLSESSVSKIADGLLSRSREGLPLDEPVRAAERYFEMTAGDIQAAFAKWMRPDGFAQVTQGPPPK
jgi:zinc protease